MKLFGDCKWKTILTKVYFGYLQQIIGGLQSICSLAFWIWVSGIDSWDKTTRSLIKFCKCPVGGVWSSRSFWRYIRTVLMITWCYVYMYMGCENWLSFLYLKVIKASLINSIIYLKSTSWLLHKSQLLLLFFV